MHIVCVEKRALSELILNAKILKWDQSCQEQERTWAGNTFADAQQAAKEDDNRKAPCNKQGM